MTVSVDNLPNDINELKRLVMVLVQENQALLEELNVRRRKMFGRSAEPHPPQGEVFNEAEAEAENPVDADTSCEDDACEPQRSDADAEPAEPDGIGAEQRPPKNGARACRRPCRARRLSFICRRKSGSATAAMARCTLWGRKSVKNWN